MLAGALPRLATALLQPTVLVAGVATGVTLGTVGVATGAIPVKDPGPRLTSLYECPGSGRVVTNLAPDQRVLVTARSADGAWLQIYVGEPGVERGWAQASRLDLKAAPDSLPIAECTPSATPEPLTAPPSIAPSATTTASATSTPFGGQTNAPHTAPPIGTPSPSPTKTSTPTSAPTPSPTKTPAPTPTPLTGPVLSGLSVYTGDHGGDGIWRIYPTTCPYGYSWNFGMTVDAADPDGIKSVTMYYKLTGGSAQSVPMTQEGVDDTLWDGGLMSTDTWPAGPMTIWFQGKDNLDHLGPIYDPATEGYKFEVATC
jgi:hypothetical protein